MDRRLGAWRRLPPALIALLFVLVLALIPGGERSREGARMLGGTPSSQPVRGVPTPDKSCAKDPARLPLPPGAPNGTPANYLHSCGGRLYDAGGVQAQITGVSWFGQEGSRYAPHGLERRNWRALLDQVATLGFNTIRLPYTNEMLRQEARVSGVDFQLNPDLRDLSPLELLDRVVAGARERGLRVILDRHRPDSGGQSPLWYTANVSEEQWIADWRLLARRYVGDDTVIGVDLHNEPKDQATWGSGDLATDWRLAAERAGNAVLDENPYLLIFVQGIQWSPWVSHWWGGYLQSVRDHPVRLKVPNRVVYSPHDYGPAVFPQPWFWDGDFPANLTAIWQEDWGYLRGENIAPVVVGEFGGRSTGPDRDGVWQQALVDYLHDNDIGYLHWSLNPDSSDTGGILADDWRTVQPARMAMLARYLAPPLGIGTSGMLGPPREGLAVLARLAMAQGDAGRRFELRLRNDGPEPVALSSLEVRASLDASVAPGGVPRVAAEGKNMPGGQLGAQLVPETAGGRLTLRLTFGEGAGLVAGYGESDEIAVRIDGVGALDLTGATVFQPAERFALYRDGQLVWGKPVGDGAPPADPLGSALAKGGLPSPTGSRFWAGANYLAREGEELGGAAGPSHAGTAAKIDADFANLASTGAPMVKWRLFNAANLPRDERGQPGTLSDGFYADLEAGLAIAARHNLYVVFSLFDPALFEGNCTAGTTATNDLTGALADAGQRRVLLDRVVTPLIERAAGNQRVLAYEIVAQPEGGWGGREQAAQSFARDVVAAIHATGKQLATVLVPPDGAARWSGLGLDYYSLRWAEQATAQQAPPGAATLKLDLPVVIGELAANGPRFGVGDLLALALREGYAGAFVGSSGPDEQLLWRGEFLAWTRRHWSAIAMAGDVPPTPVYEAQVASYGIERVRLQLTGGELVADLRLRSGASGTGRIAVMLLPTAGGAAIVAEQSVSLDVDRGTALRVRFPDLAEGQGYRLVALLRDERGGPLSRFDGLAEFSVKQGDLAAPTVVGAANRCRETGAAQAALIWGDWLANLGNLAAQRAPARVVTGGAIEMLAAASEPVAARWPSGLNREQVAKADLPVALAFAPDGRLFFVELHTGRVRILDHGALQRDPFYTVPVSGQPQAGLLGLALDPDFARNHYVYLLYTSAQGERVGGLNGPNRLLRLTDVNGRGTAPLVMASDLPSDYISNGGGLRFGPDGYLYLGLGAGANQGQAADLGSEAGKVLRFDVHSVGARAGRAQATSFARGLGSPFGLAFHPTTGQLYVTDAAGGIDELNLVVASGNYGAPAVGYQHDDRLIDPLIAYWPARQITGLEFYRGNRLPGWQNDLFFCNARRGELHRVLLAPPNYDRLASDEIVTTGCQFAVASGPEGALYFSDEQGIYRIVGR